MSKYQQVFFDFDGTICDTYPGKSLALIHTLKARGFENIHEKTIKSLVKTSLKKGLEKQFNIKDKKELNLFLADFNEAYEKEFMFYATLYDGIFDLLKKLSASVKLHIVSAKPKKMVTALLAHHKISSYFKTVNCVEKKNGCRSKTAIIAGLKKSDHCVMIGDQSADVRAAKNNHIASIAVTYGYGRKSELLNSCPDMIIAHPTEIIAKL
ncbi:hypothetical protein DNU06_07765 [Putridiphycobacter roseus]|uniref:HAD family hydrolase n=1 Tax=Putridiphycobacter roseus TaxID=2219161 RepID=A0A2W1N0H7_9FLAO|nr:HAD family hydrolase [Putridiphycobacter roseus]PZE17717.1 hypothetical protein DNU06_07765 [Putridiphycobacter roseus]